MAINLSNNFKYIKTIKIYENNYSYILVGKENLENRYNILSFKKMEINKNTLNVLNKLNLNQLFLYELNNLSSEEKKKYLETNKYNFVEKIYGFFGFVKFLLGYYIILITDIKIVGKISKYEIYRIENIKLFSLFDCYVKNDYTEKELKYISIFQQNDFCKNMYFSYTLNLTKTIQRNFVENFKSVINPSFINNFMSNTKFNQNSKDLKLMTNSIFLWNYYHLKKIFPLVNNKIWFIYIIYGFFHQVSCLIYGLNFLITVIGRRSRQFAGTRYLKRGINHKGYVANDVETEQILEEISNQNSNYPNITSFVHIRGSVPLYWYQEQINILPKPEIKLNLNDLEFKSTKNHFNNLIERYGEPIIICNLTKKKEKKKKQELLLNEWYEKSVNYINKKNNEEYKDSYKDIQYHHYDLKQLRKDPLFYSKYIDISIYLISQTNLFTYIPYVQNKYILLLQSGVIRSNCVDCLDRTNVFQQVIGTAVLLIQLRYFGIHLKEPDNEYDSIFGVLTEIYKEMGNELSYEYAGSLAHKQTIKDNRKKYKKIIQKVPEFINTFKRYFNNSFNDLDKQKGYNLFLGKYKFKNENIDIWNMNNDINLHYKKTNNYKNYLDCLKYYNTFNLIDLNEFNNKIENNIEDIKKNKNLDNIKDIIEIKLFDKSVFNNYEKLNNYFSKTKNDYIINFDEYLEYKLKNYEKYKEEYLYEKQIPFIDILINDDFRQKSFETIKYNNKDYTDLNILDEIVILNNDDFNNEDNLEKKQYKNEIREYSSFKLEENLTLQIKQFVNPNEDLLTKLNDEYIKTEQIDYNIKNIKNNYNNIEDLNFENDFNSKINTFDLFLNKEINIIKNKDEKNKKKTLIIYEEYINNNE